MCKAYVADVEYDAHAVYITKIGQEIRVPYTKLRQVSEFRGRGMNICTIDFTIPTRWGYRIVFLTDGESVECIRRMAQAGGIDVPYRCL